MKKSTQAFIDDEPKRKVTAIAQDSRILNNALLEELNNRTVYFTEAVTMLQNTFFKMLDANKEYAKDCPSGYHNSLKYYTFKTAKKFESLIGNLTPATIFDALNAVDVYDKCLLAASTPQNEREAGRKVTMLLRGFLTDLSKF